MPFHCSTGRKSAVFSTLPFLVTSFLKVNQKAEQLKRETYMEFIVHLDLMAKRHEA